jgi:hypothetical protein
MAISDYLFIEHNPWFSVLLVIHTSFLMFRERRQNIVNVVPEFLLEVRFEDDANFYWHWTTF